MKRTPVVMLLVLAFAASAGEARADDDVDKARILFDVGAQAYAAGRYADAVDAFREAHGLSPTRPTVLFSLAQAERRHFTVGQDVALLRAAIEHFRKYLELVPEGGRRADAVIALGELETISASLEQKSDESAVRKARLLITTRTPGASITLDGRARAEVPVIEVIEPGDHHIRVSAPGFVTEERDVRAVLGAVLPLEVNLRERPSSLTIAAPPGASIDIDGRNFGLSPLAAPVELPSGEHVVTVLDRGHDPEVERVSLERGRASRVDVTLRASGQRRLSYWLFGGALTSLVVGGGLAIGATVEQEMAARVLDRTTRENIDRTTLDEYQSARSSRDVLRAGAAASFGISGALGVAALATYWFDVPAPRRELGAEAKQHAIVAPLPGGAWIGVGGRF